MSRSILVTTSSRRAEINTKCEKLVESLEKVVEIESSVQLTDLLMCVRELNDDLPCGPRNLMALMENHSSDLEDFAVDEYSDLISLIALKVGKSHARGDEVPSEIAELVQITDNVEFIMQTMNALSDTKIIKKCSNFIAQLLEILLLDDSYLSFAFTRLSSVNLNEDQIIKADKFIQQLISLPDKITNNLLAHFPQTFELRKFGAILMANALKSLHILCHINKIEQSKVYDVKFLSKLISKVFVHFKSDKTVLMNSLDLILSFAGAEFYQEDVRKLMRGLARAAIESVANLAFGVERTKQKLIWTFGDVWKESNDWKYVLTKKLPLLTFSDNNLLIENLTWFLAVEDEMEIEQLLMEMLMVWSTKSHVNDTSFEQHFYVTKFVVLLTKYLTKPSAKSENIQKLLFNGIQVHLGSSDDKIQALGMITAEIVLGMLDSDLKDEDKLKFVYEKFNQKTNKEIVEFLRKLPEQAVGLETLAVSETVDDSEIVKMMEKLISIIENREDDHAFQKVLPKASEKALKVKAPEPSKASIIELDSDDDELQSYDDQDEFSSRTNEKRPRYLLDLIEAFSSKENLEDAEKFELTMSTAEEIIKQQLPTHHSDIAIDLIAIFINLDKSCYFENFEETKMKILIEIASTHPKQAAQYLCQEFNSEATKYSISRRMLMLDIIGEVAKKLSKLEMKKIIESSKEINATPSQPVNKLLIKLNQELENRNQKDAQKIIRQRLIAKTRRITTRTKAPDESSGVNRFSELVGCFFFPLVHGFGRKQMIFKSGTNLKDEIDNLLLVKFLDTISVLILCAENSLVVSKMGKEIMSLSVFLRYHDESKIRLAVLHMVAAVILAVPRKILANEFSQEIAELVNHLGMIVKSSVVNYEPDQECRDFAKQLLGMFQGTLCDDA